MTVTEIARIAGVSVSTASKILNNKDDSISAKTRERVLAIAREYGYRPYGSAVLEQGHAGVLGVLVQDHFGTMIQGIIARASALGYSTVFRYGGDGAGADSLRKGVESLLGMRTDGLILDGVGEDDPLLESVEKAGVPYVLTQRSKRDPFAPVIDYEGLGYALTYALASRGHTSIACVLREGARTEGFFAGYRRCLFECGVALDDELVFSAADGLPRNKIAARLFSGIVTSHFMDAVKLREMADELHYDIPGDLSIASLSSSDHGVSFPSISSIRIPRGEYGGSLVDYLVARVERREAPEPFETSLELCQGSSIDVPYERRAKRAVVVGSINVDNYFGFERLPLPGSTTVSSDSETFPGGKCLNEAIGIAKLGIPVVAIGRVGGDSDADYLYKSLSDHKVSTVGIRRTHDCKTGQGIVFVPHDGDSMVSIMPGANKSLSAQDIADADRLFSNASFCLVNTEVPLSAAHAALAAAKRHGLTTILKPSGVAELPDETLALVDIIAPNRKELRTLSPGLQTNRERATALLARGVGCVIATLDAQGCEIFKEGGQSSIPAIGVDAIDSTGAGDAFVAALAAYLMYGYALEDAARIATYAAGLSVTSLGSAAAMVERATLEAFIRKDAPGVL